MIDNFELIKSLFYFNEANDMFMHLQVIRRGKDHPNLPAANRTIQTYYVQSKEHLDKIKDEVIQLCEMYGARAYINIAGKDFDSLAKLTMAKLAERIYMGDCKKIYKLFNSAAGELKSRRSLFLVDVDNDELENLEEIKKWIYANISEFRKIIEIPTKTGIHLITSPFNVMQFKHTFPFVDVHKNNPTILYIPKSLDNE